MILARTSGGADAVPGRDGGEPLSLIVSRSLGLGSPRGSRWYCACRGSKTLDRYFCYITLQLDISFRGNVSHREHRSVSDKGCCVSPFEARMAESNATPALVDDLRPLLSARLVKQSQPTGGWSIPVRLVIEQTLLADAAMVNVMNARFAIRVLRGLRFRLLVVERVTRPDRADCSRWRPRCVVCSAPRPSSPISAPATTNASAKDRRPARRRAPITPFGSGLSTIPRRRLRFWLRRGKASHEPGTRRP
jgi:hypothetical protein